jgi:hypothetical protein
MDANVVEDIPRGSYAANAAQGIVLFEPERIDLFVERPTPLDDDLDHVATDASRLTYTRFVR